MIFQTLIDSPIVGILLLVMVVLSIAVHEAAHAYMAVRLGDDTPRLQGRLTLNPLSHLDPWGTLLIIFAGIGWGKPVVFNPFNLKNLRRDTALVALAGPASNFIIAILMTILLQIPYVYEFDLLAYFCRSFAFLNISLGVFNLLPIEPLDGFKVLGGVLPPHLALQWEETRKYGVIILLFLLITGGIDRIIFPIINLIANLLF